MLRDLFFYPLAGFLIAAMIAVALSFGGENSLSKSEILAEGWSLEGADLDSLTVSPGSASTYIDEDGGFVRLSQFTPDGVGPASIGVFASLGPDYERVFSGRPLRISVRARKSSDRPLDRLEVAYYPMESDPSGWRRFELTESWETYSFTFEPPIVDAPENVDLLAIFPGRAGEQEQLDIGALRVEVLNP